jgi:fimbrial chaperone protein
MELKKKRSSWRQLEILKRTALGLLLTLFLADQTTAANFDIKPIKIFFDEQTKIEKLTLKNVSEDDLTVQIKAYKWTQDEKGQDVYEDTKDLIIFPKMATLKKDEEKIVRIGTNLDSDSLEKTYRIFVEEIPSGEKEASKAATLHMYMKIGVPIFISPVKKDEKGAIEAVKLQKGKAEIKVKNQGNAHFVVSVIQVKGMNNQGKEIFSRDVGGWYILSGLSKAYEISIPLDVCKNMTRLNFEVKTNNNIILKEQLQVEKTMCGKPL